MERSDCCVVTPSRGTAPGVPARWLLTAWRAAAEEAGPACVLVPRDRILVIAWANRALSELVARDSGDLAGRPLRDLVEPDPEPAFLAGLPTVPAASADDAWRLPDIQVHPTALIGWARLAHQLARTGGGTGVARVDLADGSATRVHVVVSPVSPGTVTPPATGTGTVTLPGTVNPLPPPEGVPVWLVRVEPVAAASVAELESAVAAAEHRFTALAGCAPIGIFVSDAGLRLGYVNDAFVTLTRRSSHALLGTGWLDAVHRDDLPALYAAVEAVLGGTPVEFVVRLAPGPAAQRWLQLRLAPTTTPARAAGFIGTAEDVTERRSWEEHLTYQAHHDPLTGLVNRRQLLDLLADLLRGRRDDDREFAVLFLDLDGFKEINDTHGHDAGDRALIEVARRLHRVARESDLLARVAGDEFVVVLRHVAIAAEAEVAARRHLEVLAAPLGIGGTEMRLSASIGVALPAGLDTPESLLRAADRAIYEAKTAGPGLYRVAARPGPEPVR